MYEPQLRWVAEPGREPQTNDEKITAAVISWNTKFAVAIYDYAVPDNDATERDGRPRFRNVPYIAVRPVDENDYTAHQLREEEKTRWPRAWAAYCRMREQGTGTDIALLPGITAADLCELRALKVETVEQLAVYAGDIGTLDPFRAIARRLLSLLKPRVRAVGDGTFQPAPEAA